MGRLPTAGVLVAEEIAIMTDSEMWQFLAAATKPCKDCDGKGWHLVRPSPQSKCLNCHGSGRVPLLPELREYDLTGCESDGDCHTHLVDDAGVVYLVNEDLDTLMQATRKVGIYLLIASSVDGFSDKLFPKKKEDSYETPTEAVLRASVQAVQAREVQSG